MIMAAHMVPAAFLGCIALRQAVLWIVLAAILCVVVLVSAGFRFLYTNVMRFRRSFLTSLVLQVLAFACALLLSANWPVGVGFILVIGFGMIALGLEDQIAREHNIPNG
jgi:hypothetical protein